MVRDRRIYGITYRVCLRMANAIPDPGEIHSVGLAASKSFLGRDRNTGLFYKTRIELYAKLA
jgi:hypothetical protein